MRSIDDLDYDAWNPQTGYDDFWLLHVLDAERTILMAVKADVEIEGTTSTVYALAAVDLQTSNPTFLYATENIPKTSFGGANKGYNNLTSGKFILDEPLTLSDNGIRNLSGVSGWVEWNNGTFIGNAIPQQFYGFTVNPTARPSGEDGDGISYSNTEKYPTAYDALDAWMAAVTKNWTETYEMSPILPTVDAGTEEEHTPNISIDLEKNAIVIETDTTQHDNPSLVYLPGDNPVEMDRGWYYFYLETPATDDVFSDENSTNILITTNAAPIRSSFENINFNINENPLIRDGIISLMTEEQALVEIDTKSEITSYKFSDAMPDAMVTELIKALTTDANDNECVFLVADSKTPTSANTQNSIAAVKLTSGGDTYYKLAVYDGAGDSVTIYTSAAFDEYTKGWQAAVVNHTYTPSQPYTPAYVNDAENWNGILFGSQGTSEE